MKEISLSTARGDTYTVNPENDRVKKNGVAVPNLYPVFTGNDREDKHPMFAGIYDYNDNSIITINGRKKKVVDINSIR
jgi:hypothetical protein